jgi:hypothetical protein
MDLTVSEEYSIKFCKNVIAVRLHCNWYSKFRDLGEVEWGDVAQDRNRWRALVNPVLNLRVP